MTPLFNSMDAMRPFVSAYAAYPLLERQNLDEEGSLYARLDSWGVAGIEHPIGASLHPHDEGWFVSQIRSSWSVLLTGLPATMNRLKDDPRYGLASADPDGRRRAVDAAQELRRAALALNARLGRRVVTGVVLHSAPRASVTARASLEAFASSLTALRREDWNGATLFVEHCDRRVPGRDPDKGFLPIEDEAMALGISQGETEVCLLVNWGRSALEGRSAETPLAHLRRGRESGLLGALFFSGVTPAHAEYGEWKDSHAPFSTTCPESLLTPDAARAALAEAGPLPVLGLKVQPLPKSLGLTERFAVIRDGLDALRGAA